MGELKPCPFCKDGGKPLISYAFSTTTDGRIMHGGVKYVPERTCEDISAEYGKFVCGKCGCVVHDTSVIDNGGLNHCPDCGSVVGE